LHPRRPCRRTSLAIGRSSHPKSRAAQLLRRHTFIRFLQEPDDLFLVEPLLHV
jgi:hypothetical protein